MLSKKLNQSSGNDFTYYLPKSAKSPTVGIKDPVSSTYKEPMKFIKDNFVATSKVPFGTQSKLYSPLSISQADITHAAMECGYGPQDIWTSHFTISQTEAVQLEAFLLRRLEWALSCVEQDKNFSWTVRSFYGHLEGSDKNPVSFTLGGTFTYLAARFWLNGGGEKLKLCVHKTVYTKASVSVESQTSKSPDYLVEAGSGAWHVFESKGGGISTRPTKILEGLEQLAGSFEVGWKAKPKKFSVSSVCVHTRIDVNKRLEIFAVDPPVDGDVVNDARPHPILLIEGVCKLLLILKAINQFRALSGLSDSEDVSSEEWLLRRTDAFGGISVGIPATYLKHERSIRTRVGIYLAADEAAFEYKEGGRSFISIFMRRLRSLKLSASNEEQDGLAWTNKKHARVVAEISMLFSDGKGTFRERCADRLRLTKISRRILVTRRDKAIAVLTFGEGRFTSGGLYICQ